MSSRYRGGNKGDETAYSNQEIASPVQGINVSDGGA